MDDNTISPHQLKKDIRKDIGGCPYLLLQVPILSEISIVRKSYKTLSLTLHPDKVTGTTEEKERKVALFQRINNAQELLKNRNGRNHMMMLYGNISFLVQIILKPMRII